MVAGVNVYDFGLGFAVTAPSLAQGVKGCRRSSACVIAHGRVVVHSRNVDRTCRNVNILGLDAIAVYLFRKVHKTARDVDRTILGLDRIITDIGAFKGPACQVYRTAFGLNAAAACLLDVDSA